MKSDESLKRFETEERSELCLSWITFVSMFALSMLFMLLIAVHPITAHAKTVTAKSDYGNYTISIDDDILAEYPYFYVVYYGSSSSHYPIVYLTDEKIYAYSDGRYSVTNADKVEWALYRCYDADKSGVISVSGSPYNYGYWNKSDYAGSSGSMCFSIGALIYSNTNINYVTWNESTKDYEVSASNFFIPSEVPQIKMVQEIPAVVATQARITIPVVVFLVACLIGLVALKKPFKIFLN